MRGFAWLPRDLEPVLDAMTHEQQRVVVKMLYMARFREGEVVDPKTCEQIKVARFSFVSSYDELRRHARLNSTKPVRRASSILEKRGFLARSRAGSRTQFTFTILQGCSDLMAASGHSDGHEPGHGPGQASGQAPGQGDFNGIKNTSEDDRKPSGGARGKPRPAQQTMGTEIPGEAWNLARWHRELLLALNPQHPCGGKTHPARQWANTWAKFQREGCAEPVPWLDITDRLTWALDPSNPDVYYHDKLNTPGAAIQRWAKLDSDYLKRNERRPHRYDQVEEMTEDNFDNSMDTPL